MQTINPFGIGTEIASLLIRRGSVVQVELPFAPPLPNGGIGFGIIVQNDVGNSASPTTIVVPLVESKRVPQTNSPVHVLLEPAATNLPHSTVAFCDQIHVLHRTRVKLAWAVL